MRLRTIEESDATEPTGKGTLKSLKPLGNDDDMGRAKSGEDGREAKPPARLELATYALRKRRSTN